jgi:hypothetical protein
MHADEMALLMSEFNQGAAIPQVEASAIKQMWEAVGRMAADGRLGPKTGIGLGAYAGYGFDTSSMSPEQFLAIALRQNLLNALIQRGVLREYMQDEESREKVFVAVATIPCNKEDLAEALVQMQLSQSPVEVAAAAKEEMKKSGYDADSPRIDGKFIAWLKEECG